MTPAVTRERHALVLGAGLAGAAVCAALARQGWRLTLLDAAPAAAQGASALPVGMLSPHVTRSPTPLSRLSALGVASTRSELERLVPVGAGWQPVEVDNRGHDPGRWAAALVRPGALVSAWLTEAAALTNLQTQWNARVDRLRHASASLARSEQPTRWQALGEGGAVLAEAPCVVVATALDSRALLERSAALASPHDLPLHPVKGQLSLAALRGAPVAQCPMRDNGVFVPAYRDEGLAPLWPHAVWAMGSTYERGQTSTETSPAGHERNLASLRALCPAGADSMLQAWQANELLGWAGIRCASLDRLPLVGAVPDGPRLSLLASDPQARRARRVPAVTPRLPGLYLLTALGSRGLTLAHWCALQLARQMEAAWGAEDARAGEAVQPAERDVWPVDGTTATGAVHNMRTVQGRPLEPADMENDSAELMAALDPARFAWKRLRAGQN